MRKSDPARVADIAATVKHSRPSRQQKIVLTVHFQRMRAFYPEKKGTRKKKGTVPFFLPFFLQVMMGRDDR